MRYGITSIIMGFSGFIEINEDEYERIKAARDNLIELLLLEETLDLVTENFQEYEAELLVIASRNMIFPDTDDVSMSHQRILVSRRIVNLLSASRMYLDQCAHHLNNIYGENSENAKLAKKETSSQYDSSFGYRLMEALRNYVQHRGFPIHSIMFSGEWLDIDSEAESRLHHSVIPRISVTELASDEKFNQTVLKEMLTVQNKEIIDVRPLVREYVEGIGKIHEKIRELTRDDLINWENIINHTIEIFQKEYGANISLAGLVIVTQQENDHQIERKTIFKEIMKRRQVLERKNAIFGNLRKRYASNEIRNK